MYELQLLLEGLWVMIARGGWFGIVVGVVVGVMARLLGLWPDRD